MKSPRPGSLCRLLLSALDASDGRSNARKRDQSADAIGLGLRRNLLSSAVVDDPEPDVFEQWLLDHVASSACPGAVQAIARVVFDEWRLAHRMDAFAAWLEQGAPSEDVQRQRCI